MTWVSDNMGQNGMLLRILEQNVGDTKYRTFDAVCIPQKCTNFNLQAYAELKKIAENRGQWNGMVGPL